MVFFVLILLLIAFSSAQAAPANTFHQDYLSKDNCNAVKGIFVILILLSHGKSYIELGGIYDEPYIALQKHLGQMVVAMFFFYSGYGMMEQITKRGSSYVETIAMRRFPQLLMNFDLAVLLFWLARLLLGESVSAGKLLLSLLGWGSLGNSNWYIFDMLVLYLLVCLAFRPLRRYEGRGVRLACLTLLTVLSVLFVFVQIKAGRPAYCYNTLILFAAGYWYSFLRKPLEKLVTKGDLFYSAASLLVLAAYVFTFFRRSRGIEFYTLWAFCFTALVVLFTMKIAMRSILLRWFGEHVFSIYIMQRLPMLLLDRVVFFDAHRYCFLILSYAATVLLALLLELASGKLAGLIWREKAAVGPSA